MDPDIIVQTILQKGVKNVNISMFSESERRLILEKAAEVYLRLGKKDELLEILETIDLKKFDDMIKQLAEQYMEIGEYQKAANIYNKLGEKELAASIISNFVKKN